MHRSILFLLATCAFVAILPQGPAQAQGDGGEYLRTNPSFLQIFRESVQASSQSMVRVRCDGVDTCLGVVAGADGWILTKAHDLTGKITCRLKDGREFVAEQVGVNTLHDLCLLKIPVKQLRPITWSSSEHLRAGSWVASAGFEENPIAAGVVSVPTRKVHEAYLGAQVEASPYGLQVLNIVKKSAALKAGLRPKDVILRVDGQNFTDPDAFSQFLGSFRPGDALTLMIRRGDAVKEFAVTLQSREQTESLRAEFQNRLGSELSSRRSGYAVILQHDSVIRPCDCGGALVDLRGRVVGINISRAGRVETWAVPAEVVQPLVEEMKSGRLTPMKH